MAMPIAREIVSAGDQALAILRGLGRRDGKISLLCMIWRPRTRKGGPSWQDFHYVYSQTAVCKAFWIRGVQILPKPAHFGYISAICCHRGGVFPSEAPFGIHQAKILPRMSARESFRRIFCHRRHAENAPLRYPATADTWRTHHGEIMPSPTSGERIMVKSCHRRPVVNASW